MIPIRTDRKLRHPPLINYLIIVANFAVFIFLQHTSGDLPAGRPYLLHPDMPQVYQFFSSMFMHNDWMHLLGNMLFLWVFGNAVNDIFGNVGYLAFYLAGGVFAGVGYVLLAGAAPVLGASGAIAAVTGAFLVLFPRVRVTVLLMLPLLLMPLEVPSLIFLLLQFVWNLYYSFGSAGLGSGVAYAAHSAGYAYGIVLCLGLLAVKLLPRDVYDLLSMVHMWRRRVEYRQAVTGGYDPYGRTAGVGRWVESHTVAGPAPTEAPTPAELELRRQIAADHADGNLQAAAEKYLKLVQLSGQAVLPQAQQLDVANYLMSVQQYPAAADAYERFLARYVSYEYPGDIHLMLGIIYSRYLHQKDKAVQYLSRAASELFDARKMAMAKQELEKLRSQS